MSGHMPHNFDTHRCEGSIAAHCSLRRYHDGRGWHLSKRDVDCEWLVEYMHHVAAVRFCPWCGKDLEEGE